MSSAGLLLASLPAARVIAFEPNPPAFEKLRRVLAAYGERAQAVGIGLSDRGREESIYAYGDDLASSHACLDGNVLKELHHAENVVPTPCTLTTLTSIANARE